MNPNSDFSSLEFINACKVQSTHIEVMILQSEYEEQKGNFLRHRYRPKKCFRVNELALVRLAITTNRIDDLSLYFNDLEFYENIQSLVDDQGISGEWAFTVLNYLFAVHCFLVRFDETKAFLVRNFIVKNFAYKLRGPKRVAFMATLFIGLQYDCQFENGERWVIGIGEYFFEKFLVEKYVNNAECRVYLAFVILFFALVYAIVGGRRCEKSDEMVYAFRALNKVKISNLWDFASVLCQCIDMNNYVQPTPNQIDNFKSLDCKNQREIALVVSRLREPIQLQTESVRRLLKYLGNSAV